LVGAHLHLYEQPFLANLDRPFGRFKYPLPFGLKEIEVWSWDEDDQRAYICLLHEVGHFKLNHPGPVEHFRETYEKRVVDAEVETWEWTIRHLEEPLEPRTAETIVQHWLAS